MATLKLEDVIPDSASTYFREAASLYSLIKSLNFPHSLKTVELIFDSLSNSVGLNLVSLKEAQKAAGETHIVEILEFQVSEEGFEPLHEIILYPDVASDEAEAEIFMHINLTTAKKGEVICCVQYWRDDIAHDRKEEDIKTYLMATLASQKLSLPRNLYWALPEKALSQNDSRCLAIVCGSFTIELIKKLPNLIDQNGFLPTPAFDSELEDDADFGYGNTMLLIPTEDEQDQEFQNIPGGPFVLKNPRFEILQKLVSNSGGRHSNDLVRFVQDSFLLGEFLDKASGKSSMQRCRASKSRQVHEFTLKNGSWEVDRESSLYISLGCRGSMQLTWKVDKPKSLNNFEVTTTWNLSNVAKGKIPWSSMLEMAMPWMSTLPPTIEVLLNEGVFFSDCFETDSPLSKISPKALLDPVSVELSELSYSQVLKFLEDMGFPQSEELLSRLCVSITYGQLLAEDFKLAYLSSFPAIVLQEQVIQVRRNKEFDKYQTLSLCHGELHEGLPDPSLEGLVVLISLSEGPEHANKGNYQFDVVVNWTLECAGQLTKNIVSNRWRALDYTLACAQELGVLGEKNWHRGAVGSPSIKLWNGRSVLEFDRIFAQNSETDVRPAQNLPWQAEFYVSASDIDALFRAMKVAGVKLVEDSLVKFIECCQSSDSAVELKDLLSLAEESGPIYFDKKVMSQFVEAEEISQVISKLTIPLARFTSVVLEFRNLLGDEFPDGAVKIGWKKKSSLVDDELIAILREDLGDRICEEPDWWDL